MNARYKLSQIQNDDGTLYHRTPGKRFLGTLFPRLERLILLDGFLLLSDREALERNPLKNPRAIKAELELDDETEELVLHRAIAERWIKEVERIWDVAFEWVPFERSRALEEEQEAFQKQMREVRFDRLLAFIKKWEGRETE
jgi:hypothetical protein